MVIHLGAVYCITLMQSQKSDMFPWVCQSWCGNITFLVSLGESILLLFSYFWRLAATPWLVDLPLPS